MDFRSKTIANQPLKSYLVNLVRSVMDIDIVLLIIFIGLPLLAFAVLEVEVSGIASSLVGALAY